jgi:uncharacterized protein (UPF0332 family)
MDFCGDRSILVNAVNPMSKPPPIPELEFLSLFSNHAELASKLLKLGCPAPDISRFAEHVGKSWFGLGIQHLDEAKTLLSAGCSRAVYSRAYYAAYNASKGTRYLVKGKVSLKGDDHGRASTELPDDFPDLANWSQRLSTLYEHRLRADYDNWTNTPAEQSLSPQQAVIEADAFVEQTRIYLNTKFGLRL